MAESKSVDDLTMLTMNITLPSAVIQDLLRIQAEELMRAQDNLREALASIERLKEVRKEMHKKIFENAKADICKREELSIRIVELTYELREVREDVERMHASEKRMKDELELRKRENEELRTMNSQLEKNLKDVQKDLKDAQTLSESEVIPDHLPPFSKQTDTTPQTQLSAKLELELRSLRSQNVSLYHRIATLRKALEMVNFCEFTPTPPGRDEFNVNVAGTTGEGCESIAICAGNSKTSGFQEKDHIDIVEFEISEVSDVDDAKVAVEYDVSGMTEDAESEVPDDIPSEDGSVTDSSPNPDPESPTALEFQHPDDFARMTLWPFCTGNSSSPKKCCKILRKSYLRPLNLSPIMTDNFVLDMSDRRQGFLVCPIHEMYINVKKKSVVNSDTKPHRLFSQFGVQPWQGELILQRGVDSFYLGTYQTSGSSLLSAWEVSSLPTKVKDSLYALVQTKKCARRPHVHGLSQNARTERMILERCHFARITFTLVGYNFIAYDGLVNAARSKGWAAKL